MGDWLQDRCNAMQKAQQEHIQKSFGSDIGKSKINDLIKSKTANIGEIHTWNGKKFKKQTNGKWLEVSESGKTKKEHEAQIESTKREMNSIGDKFGGKTNLGSWRNAIKNNENHAKKLSDKEHSDEEVGLGKKKDHTPATLKDGGLDFDEYVNPDYVEITLNSGRKLQFKRKSIIGGKKLYQTILYGVNEYKDNPKAKTFIDRLIQETVKQLGDK